ncbi:unnamed protein product, partial [Lymnaea stagnalis]
TDDVSNGSPQIVSDALRAVILVVNYCILSTAINLFGTATNVINMVVFLRQGLADTVNVSLFGLAVSDLCCLLTLQWMNLCFNPLFRYSQIGFESFETQYITAGWPHVCFARITGLITAYITLERCLCVVIPLKVKTTLTPRRTVVIIVAIFFVLICSTIPPYTVDFFAMKFYPTRNRSLIGLEFRLNRDDVERVTFAFNNVYGYIGFVIVIGCTVVLVTKLNSKTKWRQETAHAGKSANASTRDRKVVKMVVMISALFIVCFLPITVVFFGTMVVPEFGLVGRHENLYHVVCSFGYGLETINSSVTIFIYLKMSSKYKSAFFSLFNVR